LDGKAGGSEMINRLIPWVLLFAYILIGVTIAAQFF
jgi:hypothetical protein